MKRLALFLLLAFAAQATEHRGLYIYCEYTHACVRRRVAEVTVNNRGRRLSSSMGSDYVQPAINIQNDTHATLHLHAISDTYCDAPTAMSHVMHSTALTALQQTNARRLTVGDTRHLMIAPRLLKPSQFGKTHICERVGTGYGGGFFLMRALGEAANAGVHHVQLSNTSNVSRTLQGLWQQLMSHGPVSVENEHALYQVNKTKSGTFEQRRTKQPTYAWPWMNDPEPVALKDAHKHAGFFVYAWCSKTTPGALAFAFTNYGAPIHLQLSRLPALPRREYFLTPGPVRYRAFRSQFYGAPRKMEQTPPPSPPQPIANTSATPTIMFEMQTIVLNGEPIQSPLPSGVYVTQSPTLFEGENAQNAVQRISIPSYSYGFFVLENARVAACNDVGGYMRGSLSTKSPQ